jgi:predicted DNA-binding transcriptional regulator YafY
VRSVTPDGDDVIVEMAIASEPWLRGLLLQLGSQGEVVDPPQWRDLAARAAEDLLAARYRDG